MEILNQYVPLYIIKSILDLDILQHKISLSKLAKFVKVFSALSNKIWIMPGDALLEPAVPWVQL